MYSMCLKSARIWSQQHLVNNGFKVVFVSDKVVISKNYVYIEKAYLDDGLFKLNVMTIINNIDSSAYLPDSDNLWHARLGHANYKSLKKIVNIESLPKF